MKIAEVKYRLWRNDNWSEVYRAEIVGGKSKPSSWCNKVSVPSQLAQAIIGKKAGDEFEMKGYITDRWKLVSIRYEGGMEGKLKLLPSVRLRRYFKKLYSGSFFERVICNEMFKTVFWITFVAIIMVCIGLVARKNEMDKIYFYYNLNLYSEIPNQPTSDDMPIISETEKQQAVGEITTDIDENPSTGSVQFIGHRLLSAKLADGSVIDFNGKVADGYATECHLTSIEDYQTKEECLDTNGRGWGIQLIGKIKK